MRKNNKQWYSVIIAMLLIGFLLVLTVTVLNLVLKEMRDNRAMWDSMKAFAWAETGKELALLKIKNQWYWVDYEISEWEADSRNILWVEWNFKKNRDVEVTYNINLLPENNSWNYEYSQDLAPGEYSIIPLFYQYDDNSIQNTGNINLQSSDGIVWNLLSWNNGIAWVGNNQSGKWKVVDNSWKSSVTNMSQQNFLNGNNNVYLILNNTSNSNKNFILTSSETFSKPITNIISSGQVGNYRHNIETKYNNTEFLNMLKYAIFSD